MVRNGDPDRTTAALFLGGAGQLIGYLVVWAIINPLLFSGRVSFMSAVMTGGYFAVLRIATKYRDAEWRAAVAPDQTLGLGLATIAILIGMTIMIWDAPGIARFRWLVVPGMLFTAWPAGVLVRLSLKEIRRRREAAAGDSTEGSE